MALQVAAVMHHTPVNSATSKHLTILIKLIIVLNSCHNITPLEMVLRWSLIADDIVGPVACAVGVVYIGWVVGLALFLPPKQFHSFTILFHS